MINVLRIRGSTAFDVDPMAGEEWQRWIVLLNVQLKRLQQRANVLATGGNVTWELSHARAQTVQDNDHDDGDHDTREEYSDRR